MSSLLPRILAKAIPNSSEMVNTDLVGERYEGSVSREWEVDVASALSRIIVARWPNERIRLGGGDGDNTSTGDDTSSGGDTGSDGDTITSVEYGAELKFLAVTHSAGSSVVNRQELGALPPPHPHQPLCQHHHPHPPSMAHPHRHPSPGPLRDWERKKKRELRDIVRVGPALAPQSQARNLERVGPEERLPRMGPLASKAAQYSREHSTR
ncbi:hypothetical protein Tco_0888308 [Tanacetum coccineum]